MFRIKDKTIHLTRGDIATLEVKAKNEDGTDYTFEVGDVVRFKVIKKKDCNCVEIKKDFIVEESVTNAQIFLSGNDTKIGDVINKPVVYWYEVELNPDTAPQTIIGFDEEGEKQFILYPEGSDE